jgi:outer membrane protein
MRSLLCPVLLAISLAPAAALGQPAPLRLSLEDAIARAQVTSHRLREAMARSDAAAAAADVQGAATLPQMSVLGGYTRTNHVQAFGLLGPDAQFHLIYPDIPDNYSARLAVQWPFYTGGRLEALQRAARIDQRAAADRVTSAGSDVTLDVTRAYWALVTAGESLRVVRQSVERADAHLKDVRNRLAAGLVPPNDVLSAEAQESRQRMLAIRAQTAREIAEAELGRLVGAPAESGIEPTAALTVPDDVTTPVDDLVDEARAARADRASLVKQVAAFEARRHAAEAERRPTVAAGGGMDYARPNPHLFPRSDSWRTSWDASVNVSLPVFDGGRAKAEAAEAAASERAVEEQLAEFDSALAVEVRQRLLELRSSRAAVDAADDAVRSATEAYRVVGQRFAAGVATSTDVLDAQTAALQADLDRTQAIANARLAEASLTRALGRTP